APTDNTAEPLRVPPIVSEATAPPPKPALDVEDSIEPTVYRFILRHSLKQQIMLLVLTLVSFPFLYYSLDLPKTIVNRAIKDGTKFPQAILGIDFERIPY